MARGTTKLLQMAQPTPYHTIQHPTAAASDHPVPADSINTYSDGCSSLNCCCILASMFLGAAAQRRNKVGTMRRTRSWSLPQIEVSHYEYEYYGCQFYCNGNFMHCSTNGRYESTNCCCTLLQIYVCCVGRSSVIFSATSHVVDFLKRRAR